MKVIQKSIPFILVLAIFMASTGFRVTISDCSDGKQKTFRFFNSPDCCCNKSANKSKTAGEDCGGLACVVPSTIYNFPNSRDSYEQDLKLVKAANSYAVFTAVIYPALQESQPYFSLPPPKSGRFKGILNQTFLI